MAGITSPSMPSAAKKASSTPFNFQQAIRTPAPAPSNFNFQQAISNPNASKGIIQTNPGVQKKSASVNTGATSGVGTGSTGAVSAQYSSPSSPDQSMFNAAPQMSQDEWLAQDSGFLDEQNAANQNYEQLLAQLAQQRSNYELDQNNTKRNLGWNGSGWNQEDRLTAYGNAFQNQQNDFASRGMMDSSLYTQANSDLDRGFNQQLSDLVSQFSQFEAGQNTDTAAAASAKQQAIAAAQRQAIQRYAATQGIV